MGRDTDEKSIYLAKASKSFINLLRGPWRAWSASVFVRRAFKLTLGKINIYFSCDLRFYRNAIVPPSKSLSLRVAHATRVHKKSLVNLHIPLKHDLLHSECVFVVVVAPSSSRLASSAHSLFCACDSSGTGDWCLSSAT